MSSRHLLVLIALAHLAGVGVLHAQPALPSTALRSALIALAALALALAALGAGSRPRTRRSLWRQMLAVLAVGLIAWAWAAWRAESALSSRLPEALEGQDLIVQGMVRGLPQPGRFGLRFELAVASCQPACPTLGRLSLTLPWTALHVRSHPTDAVSGDSTEAAEPVGSAPPVVPMRDPVRPTLQPGARLLLKVRLKRPHALVNPGAFDRELRWLQEGIDGVGQVRQVLPERAISPAPWARIGPQGISPLILIERWRARLRDAMVQAMQGAADRAWRVDRAASEGTLLALAVGDQAAIDGADWSLFNRTGIGHLMSISGLHITVLAGAAGTLAAWLWRSPWACRRGLPLRWPAQRVRWCTAMVVALFYALLAGWGIPAQRTAFMLMAAALLMLSGRASSMAVILSAALILVLGLDPWSMLAPGFWLSFGAVGVLVWAGQSASAHSAGRWQALRVAAQTQWAATLAMLPLGVLFFGNVSLVGPVANALAIPLVTLVLTPAALLGGALSALHPTLGAIVLTPALWVTDGLLHLVARLSGLPWAVASLPSPPMGVILLALLGMLLMLAPRGLAPRAAGALALVPLVWVPADRPHERHWRLTALDVGQGSALVLQAARYTLVFDTGPGQPGGSDAGERIVVPWLQRAGLRRVDELIVSHLDLDHSGGLKSLLGQIDTDAVRASFGPELVGLTAFTVDSPPAARAWQACVRGDTWTHAGVRFTVLHPRDPPEPARGESTNAVSCVLRVDGPGWRILFTGDIEAAQERRLLEVFPVEALRSDILVVPHHGSITSSTEAFLDAVRPTHAIVQSAYRSRYRHPHPTVLARYAARDIQVWRTDHHGAITLDLEPQARLRIRTARQTPARYWRVSAAGGPSGMTPDVKADVRPAIPAAKPADMDLQGESQGSSGRSPGRP